VLRARIWLVPLSAELRGLRLLSRSSLREKALGRFGGELLERRPKPTPRAYLAFIN
jgi:hypothetical protein